MCAEDHSVIITVPLSETSAHFDRGCFVYVGFTGPVREFKLNRMMAKIAGDNCVLSLRRDANTVMARSVPRGWL